MHDGREALTLQLDHESALIYLPTLPGLPENIITELEDMLHASEAVPEENAPPEDACRTSGSGRRQWVVAAPDRPIGWSGPRRWQRGSWKLNSHATGPVMAIRDAIEAAAASVETAASSAALPRLREVYNTVLINRYPTGADTIKWHSDDEKWYYVGEQRDNSDIVIASVSLGAERWFEFRSNPQRVPKESRRTVRIRLRSGSVLLMAGATQRQWQHALPKDEACIDVRYNLTFRRVLTVREDPRLSNVPCC